jgi:hypothetical protein
MKKHLLALALISLSSAAADAQPIVLDGNMCKLLSHAASSDGTIQFNWTEVDTGTKPPQLRAVRVMVSAQAQMAMLNQLSHAGYIAGVPFVITQAGKDALKPPNCPGGS